MGRVLGFSTGFGAGAGAAKAAAGAGTSDDGAEVDVTEATPHIPRPAGGMAAPRPSEGSTKGKSEENKDEGRAVPAQAPKREDVGGNCDEIDPGTGNEPLMVRGEANSAGERRRWAYRGDRKWRKTYDAGPQPEPSPLVGDGDM